MSDLKVGDLAYIVQDYYGILYDLIKHQDKIGLVVAVRNKFYYQGKGKTRGDQFTVMWPSGISVHPSGALKRADT